MHLKGKQPVQFAFRFLMVDKLCGCLAIHLMNQVVTARDDFVFIPHGHFHFDRCLFFNQPLGSRSIHNHFLPVLGYDPAPAFVIDHCIVGRRWMNVALVAADGPFTNFRQFAASILDARVVACLPKRNAQFKILDFAAAPNQKLVVGKWLVRLGNANDRSVLNAPKLWVSIPTRKVFAIEKVSFLCVKKRT